MTAEPPAVRGERTEYVLDRRLIRRLSEDLCRGYEVVLLGRDPEDASRIVPLGMAAPDELEVASLVEKETGFRVRRVQLSPYEVDEALRFGFEEGEEDAESRLRISPIKERIRLAHARRIAPDGEQANSAVVADILSEAIRRRATDVHIETYGNEVDVRFRIDGALHAVATPIRLENVRGVLSYIKVLSDLDIAERRHPQDGHVITLYADGDGSERRVDMRVSFLPGPYGEDVVLRILDETRLLLDLETLGMEKECYERFHRMLHTPGGMVLVTGPTGSGKTTTLYAALAHLTETSRKILTVEDPIEYELPKVNQKQVSSVLSFADYTRAFMRQNPDVLMIGEVRDEETARMALRAAQMGHLVLTTLHTRDAPSAVARMMSLGADASVLASGLLGALSQRLVRRICPDCAETYTPDPEALSHLGTLPAFLAKTAFRAGRGCAACAETGYLGQTGVFELLRFDVEIRRALAHGGMDTMDLETGGATFRRMIDDAFGKIAAGVTTVEEVARNVPVADVRADLPTSCADESGSP